MLENLLKTDRKIRHKKMRSLIKLHGGNLPRELYEKYRKERDPKEAYLKDHPAKRKG